MNAQALPFIILLATIYGSNLTVSRFSIGQYAPITFVGLRLALASVCHAGVYLLSVRGQQWPSDRQLWKHAAVLGIFDTALPMSLFVASLEYLSSGLTSILATTSPAIIVLLAHFFLEDERLSRPKLAGVTLALGGAVLLAILGESGIPDVSQANPIGFVMLAVAILSGSAMSIYGRKYMRECNAFQVGSVRTFVAALVVVPFSLLTVGFNLNKVDSLGVISLGYSAVIGTFVGFTMSFYNIKRFGATAASMVMYVAPVVASLAGMLLLDEQITGGMAAGMALILGGIAILNRHSAPSALDPVQSKASKR